MEISKVVTAAVLAVSILQYSGAASASALEDGRVAIIHASKSTIDRELKLLRQLKASGIIVIGRYLARCYQADHPTKTLVRGSSTSESEEIKSIFGLGMAVVSIYQYRAGVAEGVRKFTRGLSDLGMNCEQTRSVQEISVRRANGLWTSRDEGTLDGEAAAEQASRLGQPKNTAIYFGVDYNYTGSDAERLGLIRYFESVRRVLDRPEYGYRVGAYGNGAALGLLIGKQPDSVKLVDLTWLSPSRSYQGTSEFYSSGDWDIFHAQSNNAVIFTDDGECVEYEYDVDIQNPRFATKDLGFWFRDTTYSVPEYRTLPIFEQRRFICGAKGVVRPARVKICDARPRRRSNRCVLDRACVGQVVRILPGHEKEKHHLIDYWDDGGSYGKISALRLTRSLSIRPLYDKERRSKTSCTCAGSTEDAPCNGEFR